MIPDLQVGVCARCQAPLAVIPRDDGLSILGDPDQTPHVCGDVREELTPPAEERA